MRTSGFTIIEILVSILILSLLMVVLYASLSGSMNLNRKSQVQMNTTSSTQELLEKVKAAWLRQGNYDTACVPGLTIPSGYTVKFINLSTRAQPVTSANVVTTTESPYDVSTSTATPCPAATNSSVTVFGVAYPPAMRRIVVSSGTTVEDTELKLDVLRP